jgi:dUTP pyrophosphatase
MNVKAVKLCEGARLPVYQSESAAGADLFALAGEKIPPFGTALIKTGIALEIPEGHVGLVCARSGMALKRGLAPANKVGVIDSDYRGEIMVALYNQTGSDREVSKGERIAQLLIVPCAKAEFCEAETLSETGRGEGGFGSTGTGAEK